MSLERRKPIIQNGERMDANRFFEIVSDRENEVLPSIIGTDEVRESVLRSGKPRRPIPELNMPDIEPISNNTGQDIADI